MFPSHVWSAANVTGANKPAEPNARLLDGKGSRNWVVRNVSWLKSFIRIILGIVWLIDGYLKFSPGLVDSFPALIKSEGDRKSTRLNSSHITISYAVFCL